MRDNPAGRIASSGITAPAARLGSWSTRDTRTHEISSAPQAARQRGCVIHEQARQQAAFRLAKGGLIDRSQPCCVHVRRPALVGLAGDTLASALLAPGHASGRPQLQVSSPARHPHRRAPRSRTRSSSCAPAPARAEHQGDHRSSCSTGSKRASQNRWPSLALRSASRSTRCSRRFFGAGFYYKTFMWPAAFWETRLRAADPPRRRSRPRCRGARSRPLRAGECVLRRADHRRRAGRIGGGASRRRDPARASFCAMRISRSAVAC